MVEFALALPILMLLAAGTIEVGRGYQFGVATSDAARDGARYVAGKTATTNGPGLANMCSLVTGDLAAVTSNVVCSTQDRKSTRLNSSHSQISYAVFCLKKKKT